MADTRAEGPGSPGYWHRVTPAAEIPPALAGRVECDVAIIGGGFSGLSTALHCAEAGLTVCVLEAGTPGIGASGRNAGQWLPGWVARTPAQVEATHGAEAGASLNRFNVDCARLVPALIRRLGIHATGRHCGVLQVAADERSLARLTTVAEQWRRHGAAITDLDRPGLAAYLRSDHYRGGILFEDAGCLNPLAYTRGLATAAVAAGARLSCHSPAHAIEAAGPDWQVATQAGCVRAHQVVLAIDAFDVPGLWPDLERSYYRLPVPMLCSTPLENAGRDFLPHATPFAELCPGGLLFGGMLDENGRWVASVAPSLRQRDPGPLGAWALRRFRRVFPQVAPFGWQEGWWGTLGLSRDTLPRVYRLAPGVHALNGYSGGGIALATGLGRALAGVLAGDDARALPLPPRPLERVPLRRLLPWLLRAAVPLAKGLDRLRG